MDVRWILNLLTQWGALGLAFLAFVALLACLRLFIRLKREVRAATLAAEQGQEAARGGLTGLAQDVRALQEGLRQLEAASPAAPPGVAINLTKRAQALRMRRRGEPIPTIAAALKTPQNEIGLLLKIHEALHSPEA